MADRSTTIVSQLLVLVLLALPAGAAAQASNTPAIDDLKAQEDPTILTSRIWIENEYNDDRDHRGSLEITLGGRKGWRISDDHDWAVQLEVPYRRIWTGDEDDREGGLADIKVSAGTAVRLGKQWRAGGGIELRMPTGEDELSANIWRLQEFAAVAWDATPWLTLSPKVKHYHTIAREGGATRQYYVEINLPATFLLPDNWSVTPRYDIKLDFENDRTDHSGKLSVGKRFQQPKVGFGSTIKIPLDDQTNEFQLTVVLTKYY